MSVQYGPVPVPEPAPHGLEAAHLLGRASSVIENLLRTGGGDEIARELAQSFLLDYARWMGPRKR